MVNSSCITELLFFIFLFSGCLCQSLENFCYDRKEDACPQSLDILKEYLKPETLWRLDFEVNISLAKVFINIFRFLF